MILKAYGDRNQDVMLDPDQIQFFDLKEEEDKKNERVPYWTDKNNHELRQESKRLLTPEYKSNTIISDPAILKDTFRSCPVKNSGFRSLFRKHNSVQTFHQASLQFRTHSTLIQTNQKYQESLSQLREIDKEKKDERKELKKRIDALKSIKNRYLRVLKFNCYLTDNQEQVITRLFGAFRWFYNRTLEFCKRTNKWSFYTVRDQMRKEGLLEKPDWWDADFEIPFRIIRGAIEDCCSAYKSAKSNFDNGNISRFELKPKTKKDDSQTLLLYEDMFSKTNKLCPSILKTLGTIEAKCVRSKRHKLVENTDLSDEKEYLVEEEEGETIQFSEFNIQHDCRMSFKNGRYTLLVPEERDYEEWRVESSWVAIDEGLRSLLTGYSPMGHSFELGKGMYSRFKHVYLRMDKIRSLADKATTKKRKRQLMKRLRSVNKQERDKMDDFHWKICKFLTSNYHLIVLSDFKTASLFKNKKLSHLNKRIMSSQRHFELHERLKQKCKQTHCQLLMVDESYTTKTCSCCGTLNHNIKKKKIFVCPNPRCGVIMDRDVNAAKNMYLKHLGLVKQCLLEHDLPVRSVALLRGNDNHSRVGNIERCS